MAQSARVTFTEPGSTGAAILADASVSSNAWSLAALWQGVRG
jgi:hypothetical protein